MQPALIIIDVQNGIDEAVHWGGKRNNPEAEGNIKLLLDFWRGKALPIFIIKHDSVQPDSPLRPGQNGNDLKFFIQPADDAIVIAKTRANAFIGTVLEQELRSRQIEAVYIAGFVTNNSVEATARMSGDLGFETTVVSDATACFAKVGTDGVVYSAELIHQLSLANLAGEYASIASTAAVTRKLTNFTSP